MRFISSLLLVAGALADKVAQIHFISSGSAGTGLTAAWTTTSAQNAEVRFGLSPDSLNQTVSGETTSYSCLSYTSPQLHHATLTGLTPDTTYYYQVGDFNANVVSDVRAIKTLKALNPDTPVTFALVGDLGQTNNSQRTVDQMMSIADTFDAIIHVGDLSYADGDQPRWDSWGTLVDPIASIKPYHVLIGNHDLEQTCTQEFNVYQKRFPIPYADSLVPSPSPNYYSFETGSVHVVVLNSYETSLTATSPQYLWFQKDLSSVNRKLTPFLVVVLHAPWYNSNYAHYTDGAKMMKVFEPLLYQYEVDIMFAGHVHAYERWTRSYDYDANARGSYHITIGDGGNREGLATTWHSPQPSNSKFRQSDYGFGIFSITNRTHAVWEWHRDVDDVRTITDSFEFETLAI